MCNLEDRVRSRRMLTTDVSSGKTLGDISRISLGLLPVFIVGVGLMIQFRNLNIEDSEYRKEHSRHGCGRGRQEDQGTRQQDQLSRGGRQRGECLDSRCSYLRVNCRQRGRTEESDGSDEPGWNAWSIGTADQTPMLSPDQNNTITEASWVVRGELLDAAFLRQSSRSFGWYMVEY